MFPLRSLFQVCYARPTENARALSHDLLAASEKVSATGWSPVKWCVALVNLEHPYVAAVAMPSACQDFVAKETA